MTRNRNYILGRTRNTGYIKYATYSIAWPRILKIGQIENRLKLLHLVPSRWNFIQKINVKMYYCIISYKTIFMGDPAFRFRPNIFLCAFFMVINAWDCFSIGLASIFFYVIKGHNTPTFLQFFLQNTCTIADI